MRLTVQDNRMELTYHKRHAKRSIRKMLVILARDIPPQSDGRVRLALAVVGMEQPHPVLVLLPPSHRLPWGCQTQPANAEVS